MASEEHRQHVIASSLYVGIWAILMVLTGLTVFASYIEMGDFNIVVALVIATIKATLGPRAELERMARETLAPRHHIRAAGMWAPH